MSASRHHARFKNVERFGTDLVRVIAGIGQALEKKVSSHIGTRVHMNKRKVFT